MTNRPGRGPDAHAGHDPLLIAAHAAGDADARDRVKAEALVAGCAECAQLATDLRLIASATAALPPVGRPRDFTIAPEQAARLRPTSWRSLANRLGWIRGDFGRVLAAGLTTLGLAGLLVLSIPAQFAGRPALLNPVGNGAGGAAAPSGAAAAPSGAAPSEAPVLAPSYASPAASAAPAASGPTPAPAGNIYRSQPSQQPEVGVTGEGGRNSESASQPSSAADSSGQNRLQAQPTSPDTLLVVSLVSLALGIGLFVLRRTAFSAAD
jgi:hypothetical protein